MMQPSEFGKRNPSTSLQQSSVNFNKSRGDYTETSRIFHSLAEGLNHIQPEAGVAEGSQGSLDHLQRRKEIFVGGITKDTTVKELSWAFSYFGRVTHVRIMTNFDGASRGFAFVKYKHVRSAEAAVKTGFLQVGSITTEIRSGLSINGSQTYKDLMLKHKVFIGGISSKLQHSDILNYLSRYGQVLDFIQTQHPTTGVPANYGFAIFAEKRGADRFLSKKGGHIIKGLRLKTGPASANKKTKLEDYSNQMISRGSHRNTSQQRWIFTPDRPENGLSNHSSSEGSSSAMRERWESLDHPEDNLVFNLRIGRGSSATSRYLTNTTAPNKMRQQLLF